MSLGTDLKVSWGTTSTPLVIHLWTEPFAIDQLSHQALLQPLAEFAVGLRNSYTAFAFLIQFRWCLECHLIEWSHYLHRKCVHWGPELDLYLMLEYPHSGTENRIEGGLKKSVNLMEIKYVLKYLYSTFLLKSFRSLSLVWQLKQCIRE